MNIKELLNGNKTYIGGTGAILIGIGKVMYDWYIGDIQPAEEYLTWIIIGWTIIGGRSALKKLK